MHIRQLFSGKLVPLHDSRIQEGLVISVKGQAAFVAPLFELDDDALEQFLICLLYTSSAAASARLPARQHAQHSSPAACL